MASETTGDRIRRYRRLKHLTQQQLATKAGTDKGYISRLEAGGIAEPSLEVLRRIAHALEVPLRAIADPGWYEDASTEDWLIMLMADERLDEDAKRTIERLVRLEVEAAERAKKVG